MAELMRLLGIMRPTESETHSWAVGQAETVPEEGNLSGLWLGRGDGELEGGEGSYVGGNEDVSSDEESEAVDVAPEDTIKNSVGFKMLGRMGWKEGKGIGLRGDGRLDPVFACNKDEYGVKGAGLRHLSEALMLQGKNRKRPEDMESWERGACWLQAAFFLATWY